MDNQDLFQSDRERISEALQSCEGLPLEGSLLVGWVLIAEWLHPDGTQLLSRFGSENLTQWQRQGYLHNALHESWEDEEFDD